MTGPRDPEPEPELGEIEWLDGGGPDNPRDPGHQPSRIPRAAWYALVVVVLGAVVIALTVSRHPAKHRAAATPSRTSTPPPSPSSTSIIPDPPSPTPSPASTVTVRNLGHRLLEVARGVDLFAWSQDGVMVRLELATGRVTRTTGAELTSSAPESMVPTRHGVLLMSYDPGSGFLIPDGKRPVPLPDRIAQDGGSVAPGPDPDHVWLMSNLGTGRAVLVGLDGRPAGPTIADGGNPDDTGYLVVPLTGGVYFARPGSLQRITSGALIAIGPTRWLTEECDDQHRCSLDVTDRATGEHHVLGPTGDRPLDSGQISPDGSTAALAHLNNNDGSWTLHLVDLDTGADRSVMSLERNLDQGAVPLVWTPDSRWLIAIGEGGQLAAVDRNGHARVLTGAGPSITHIALRVP